MTRFDEEYAREMCSDLMRKLELDAAEADKARAAGEKEPLARSIALRLGGMILGQDILIQQLLSDVETLTDILAEREG